MGGKKSDNSATKSTASSNFLKRIGYSRSVKTRSTVESNPETREDLPSEKNDTSDTVSGGSKSNHDSQIKDRYNSSDESKSNSAEHQSRWLSGQLSVSHLSDSISSCEFRDDGKTCSKGEHRCKEKEKKVLEYTLRKKHEAGVKYLSGGNVHKSVEIFKDIYNILDEKKGKEHHRVGTALYNVGSVHLLAGNIESAFDAIKDSVKIRENALGENHPMVVESLIELGIVLLSGGEFEESLDTFNRALDLNMTNNPPGQDEDEDMLHLQQAKILNNIGCVYFEYGDIESAIKIFTKSLELYNKFYKNKATFFNDPRGLGVAFTQCNIAYCLLMSDEKYDEAGRLLGTSLKIQRNLLGSRDKRLLQTLNTSAFTCVQLEWYDKALKFYKEILNAQESCLKEKHIDRAITMKKMVFVYLKLFRFEEAEKMLKDVKYIEEAQPDRDVSLIAKTRSLLKALEKYNLSSNHWDSFVLNLRKAGFKLFESDGENIDMSGIMIKQPNNKSKMTGHQVRLA